MTRNNTLENAKALLNERFRIDAKDSGTMSEFFRSCHTQLMYVCGELESQISTVGMLKKELADANSRTKKEELNSFYEY